MRSYFLQILENIIGISAGILFIYGFYMENKAILIAAGVGTILFMISQLEGQPRNAGSYFFMLVIGSIVAAFISKWYIGLFWVSAVYAIGQTFGLLKLLANKNELVLLLNLNNAGGISSKDLLAIFLIIIIPVLIYFFSNSNV